MSDTDGVSEVAARRGDNRVETDYVDRHLDQATAPASAYSVEGEIYAARLFGSSSALRRPGWPRTTARVGFWAISAIVGGTLVAAALNAIF